MTLTNGMRNVSGALYDHRIHVSDSQEDHANSEQDRNGLEHLV